MLVLVLLARQYIKGYWTPNNRSKDGKPDAGMRIPLPNMEDYNEALKRTEQLMEVLEYLEYSWVGTSVVAAMVR